MSIDSLNIRDSNRVHKLFVSLNIGNKASEAMPIFEKEAKKLPCPACGGEMGQIKCKRCNFKPLK